MLSVRYRSGYKYQLVEDYSVVLPFAPPHDIVTSYITFSTDGRLTLRAGYASDGPSGPTIDTPNFMRGAFEHDGGYQLCREGHLNPDVYRKLFDGRLYQVCREDGMSAIRAWWVYQGVRWGGGPSADPAHDKPILTAP